jgi:hypothetical protein
MAQPEFVPVAERDRVQVGQRLPNPDPWVADRVGELRPAGAQPAGPQMGIAGPDQGYALKLAHHLEPRLVLTAHEHAEDAIAGCLGVALKRAALYGRAPIIGDLELAFSAWGFLDTAPAELVAYRRPFFNGVAERYGDRRIIADAVDETVLRMTPAEVSGQVATGWRSLLGAPVPAGAPAPAAAPEATPAED